MIFTPPILLSQSFPHYPGGLFVSAGLFPDVCHEYLVRSAQALSLPFDQSASCQFLQKLECLISGTSEHFYDLFCGEVDEGPSSADVDFSTLDAAHKELQMLANDYGIYLIVGTMGKESWGISNTAMIFRPAQQPILYRKST